MLLFSTLEESAEVQEAKSQMTDSSEVCIMLLSTVFQVLPSCIVKEGTGTFSINF